MTHASDKCQICKTHFREYQILVIPMRRGFTLSYNVFNNFINCNGYLITAHCKECIFKGVVNVTRALYEGYHSVLLSLIILFVMFLNNLLNLLNTVTNLLALK